jgi:hypothetical protein
VKDVEGLHVIDSVPIISNRTKTFENISSNVFLDTGNSLWMTSALRFFLLEDLLRDKGWKELMHVEADNMLYGRITTILPGLRHHYRLAATPLNVQVTFITASLFWVSNLNSIVKFNDYLLALALNTNGTHDNYVDYLRPSSWKVGGLYPDKNGVGIKLYAINEMSMLAYYHNLHPEELALFPVVPAHQYPVNRNIPNVTVFSPMGERSGYPIAHGIWDSNSWGQFIGGTHDKRGRNKRFTDGSHISGMAIRCVRCTMVFWCNNITEFDYAFHHRQHHGHGHHPHGLHGHGPALPHRALTSESSNDSVNSHLHSYQVQLHQRKKGRCYTAPYVRCGGDLNWTPLWNLHVHSKSTIDFKSTQCDCEREAGNPNNITIFVDNDDYQWKPEKSPL